MLREIKSENIEIIFDKKVVLFVGRIDDNKGVSHLLKIFYEKEKELEEYSLVIIGKIEEEQKNIDTIIVLL